MAPREQIIGNWTCRDTIGGAALGVEFAVDEWNEDKLLLNFGGGSRSVCYRD